MAKGTALWWGLAAAAAMGGVVLLTRKSRPTPLCIHVKTQEQWTNLREVGTYPFAIVYYPDDVAPEAAQAMFCGTLVEQKGWTVVLGRASDISDWEGVEVAPGAGVIASPGADLKPLTWAQLMETPP